MKPADDGLPDDRIVCADCRHCDAGSYRCHHYRTSTLPDLPRRCMGFVPDPRLPDQRPGRARWPDLKQVIADIRALDEAHRHAVR